MQIRATQENTRCRHNAGVMLGHRPRRWPNIKRALCECLAWIQTGLCVNALISPAILMPVTESTICSIPQLLSAPDSTKIENVYVQNLALFAKNKIQPDHLQTCVSINPVFRSKMFPLKEVLCSASDHRYFECDLSRESMHNKLFIVLCRYNYS